MNPNINEWVKEYDAGTSFKEIGTKYDVPGMTVYRNLKKIGTKLRSKSESQKLALASGKKQHPTAGKERSLEERTKISNSQAAAWDSMDDEEYKRRVKDSKQRWENIPDKQKADMIKNSAKSLRKASKEGSAPEKFLVAKLREHGFTVLFHEKNVLGTDLELDIVLPDLKTVIEVDGASHRKAIFTEKQLVRQQKNDAKKNGIILSSGLVLLRVKYLKSGRLNLHTKNELETKILHEIKKIEQKFPSKKSRLIEITIGE